MRDFLELKLYWLHVTCSLICITVEKRCCIFTVFTFSNDAVVVDLVLLLDEEWAFLPFTCCLYG